MSTAVRGAKELVKDYLRRDLVDSAGSLPGAITGELLQVFGLIFRKIVLEGQSGTHRYREYFEDDLTEGQIASSDTSVHIQILARRIAEAQIDLLRVRGARHRLLSEKLSNPNYDSLAACERR
jgi:hypothetical protein